MTSKIFAAVCLLLLIPSAAFASTQTCGSSIGGTGALQFSFNTGWYGHACKFTNAASIDVTAIQAEIDRIATTQTFALAVYADSGNKPSGTAIVSGNVSSVTANCTVYTATVATTTLAAGTYWITAIPTTHSTAYICGAGSATVSDQDSSNVWATGYAGAYYLALTYDLTPAVYYTLSYSAGSGGTISGSSTQYLLSGTRSATTSAVADSGYTFSAWSDGSTSSARSDVATATASWSASFSAVSSSSTATSSTATLDDISFQMGIGLLLGFYFFVDHLYFRIFRKRQL